MGSGSVDGGFLVSAVGGAGLYEGGKRNGSA